VVYLEEEKKEANPSPKAFLSIKSNRALFIYLLLPFNKLEGSLNKYDNEIIFMDFMQIVYFILFYGCVFESAYLGGGVSSNEARRDIRRKINIYGTIGIFGENIFPTSPHCVCSTAAIEIAFVRWRATKMSQNIKLNCT
jgi:hypothetical protein